MAYNKYIRDINLDPSFLPLPLVIIGQLDKTFIDSKGKLTLEPFKITLHIFKECVRRHDFAWRPLGYISNQSNLPQYKRSKDKASDYHVILNEIMKSFKQYQETYDVFLWDMVIHQSIVHIAFKPLFGYIIGDNEGHDKTCGKYLNRMNVQRLCRCCDTPLDKSDDPFYTQWRYTQASLIANLATRQSTEELQEMSYHCIKNAMTGVLFADPKRGINGATPAERLHLLNHGLFQLILEYNFGLKRAKSTWKTVKLMFSQKDNDNEKVEECQTDDDEVQEEGPDKDISNGASLDVHESGTYPNVQLLPATDDLTNVALFTSKICDMFDKDAKLYGRLLQKQSSRYWNRSFFYQGVTSNSKKVGHEERNCLMLCLLIYTSSRHDFYSSALDPPRRTKKHKKIRPDHPDQSSKRLDYLIELISETLLLEQFMMQKSIRKSMILKVEKYIPLYLQFLKDVCQRDKGMGWKLTKFHIVLHMADDIKRLSIPMNYDSNVVESHHKEEKKSGNRTQMRASTIEKQTALRRTEFMLIERAYNQINPPLSLFDDDASMETNPSLSSMKMIFDTEHGLCYTPISRGCRADKVLSFPEHDYLVEQINEFFSFLFKNTMIPSDGIKIYTRMTQKQNTDDNESAKLYRGDPFWTSKHSPNSFLERNDSQENRGYDPWHDFVFVQWRTSSSESSENRTDIPARIIFFMEIPIGCEGIDQDMIVYPPGTYALVQSCVEDLNANPPTSQTSIDYYKEKYGSQSSFQNYFVHPSCSILFWTMMEWTFFQSAASTTDDYIKVPKLYITSTKNICGSCIAVPYNLDQQPSIEWIIIRNRDEWEDSFDEDMNVRLGL
jgi:hypothetical protein